MSDNLEDLELLAALSSTVASEAKAINDTRENPKQEDIFSAVDTKSLIAKEARERGIYNNGGVQQHQHDGNPQIPNVNPLGAEEIFGSDGFEDEFGSIQFDGNTANKGMGSVRQQPQPQNRLPANYPPSNQPQDNFFRPELESIILRKIAGLEVAVNKLVEKSSKK